MRLFIAEKPSLALAIANGLGNPIRHDGYYDCGSDIVTYCFGHIMQQYNPDEYDEKYKVWAMDTLPIKPEKWKLKVSPSCKKQYKIIKQLAEKADIIVNAGDPDREGQLLVDEVLNEFGLLQQKKIQRILLNALDEKSVKTALKDLRDNKEFSGLRNSALARSRADWLIGMNFTRAYTLKAGDAGHNIKFSIGRVQTPTAALIVRRENEIKNFKPVEFFNLLVTWNTASNANILTTWQVPDDCDGTNTDGKLIDRAVAERVCGKLQGAVGKITSVEQKPGKKQQRLPYSLSSLQIDAGRMYGFTPQQVLDIQQSLYEKKLTTYPRSDCEYLPTNQITDIGKILDNLKSVSTEMFQFANDADIKIRSRAWDDKKITAHHAIIPTTVKPDFSSLTNEEKKMYELVARAYIAQFYPAQTFLTTTVLVEGNEELFKATGTVIQEMGWKKLYRSHDNEDEKENHLPSVSVGESVNFLQGEIKSGITKPPARFTPATLIKAMKEIWKYVHDDNLKDSLKECSGIGTEATRASIIETIQDRGYVKLEKKNLVPTEIGFLLLDIVDENMTYPDITAKWEHDLDAISRREMPIQEFMQKQEEYIDMLLANLKKIEIKKSAAAHFCPNCKKPLRRIKGKNGFFWSCTGYPDCKTSYPDKKGKPDTSPRAKPSHNGPKCPKCNKPLVQRQGKKGKFWGCSGYPDCNTTFFDQKGKPDMRAQKH